MKPLPVRLPPIPADTARAASSLFGKGNIYIRVGEHLDELFDELPPLEMEIHGRSSPQANARYALMTAFQFAEQLTDRQMAEAVRNRVDLKYALHLPMSYPSFDPVVLCMFRKHLITDITSSQAVGLLLARLAELGLLKSMGEQSWDLESVLTGICTGSRLEIIIEAIYQALEALTVANYEWLRQVALPHWYTRYSRQTTMPFWPFSEEKLKASALEIAADIRYLLGEIDKSQQPGLVSLREIQYLRQVWADQFVQCPEGETHSGEVQLRPACTIHGANILKPQEGHQTQCF
jgi:transposase